VTKLCFAYSIILAHRYPANCLVVKPIYADDTYLIVPCVNSNSCALELDNICDWAENNNQKLNRSKSTEIIFFRSKLSSGNLPPVLNGITRVKSLKVLGVTITDKLRVDDHVDITLKHCVQSLYALHVLRTHGLPDKAIQLVFNSVIIAQLFYASPAWWGLTLEADKNCIESFLRKSKRFGFCAQQATSAEYANAKLEETLFRRIVEDPSHVLHHLLPPVVMHSYNTRKRQHNLT
jgi:hypothetical protein